MDTSFNEAQGIFEKQLKGISGKIVLWIIISTASVCSTVISTYFVMSNKIELNTTNITAIADRQQRKDEEDKTRNLQINALQIQYNVLEARVNDLERQQDRYNNTHP